VRDARLVVVVPVMEAVLAGERACAAQVIAVAGVAVPMLARRRCCARGRGITGGGGGSGGTRAAAAILWLVPRWIQHLEAYFPKVLAKTTQSLRAVLRGPASHAAGHTLHHNLHLLLGLFPRHCCASQLANATSGWGV